MQDLGRHIAQPSHGMKSRRGFSGEAEHLRSTLDAIDEAILAVDEDGRLRHLNRTAEALTGWAEEEAKGRLFEEIIPLERRPDGSDPAELLHRSLLDGHYLEPAEILLLRTRQGRILRIRAVLSPVRREARIAGLVVRIQPVDLPVRHPSMPSTPEIAGSLESIDRVELERRLDQILSSTWERGTVHALCCIRLDPAPEIIEAIYGEPRQRVEGRILECLTGRVRQSDSLAWLEVGILGLLLPHCPLDKATEVAESLLRSLRGLPYAIDGVPRPIKTSLGIAPISAEAESVGQVLERARQACDDGHALASNRVQVYRSESSDRAQRRYELPRAIEVRRALEANTPLLYAHPIVPQRQGLPVHHEVLLRMPDGQGGVLSPGAFVLAAERYGLTGRLDRWIFRQILQAYPDLFGGRAVPLMVNLSARTLGDEKFLRLVRRGREEGRIPDGCLCFEITETAAIECLEAAQGFLHQLRKLGCRLALDDFGSGYASFRYLKSLQVDLLKIDGELLRESVEEDKDLAMIEAICQLGRVLGIRVVAEGVESRDILERLRVMGVDYVQGYVYGEPRPLREIARELRQDGARVRPS